MQAYCPMSILIDRGLYLCKYIVKLPHNIEEQHWAWIIDGKWFLLVSEAMGAYGFMPYLIVLTQIWSVCTLKSMYFKPIVILHIPNFEI